MTQADVKAQFIASVRRALRYRVIDRHLAKQIMEDLVANELHSVTTMQVYDQHYLVCYDAGGWFVAWDIDGKEADLSSVVGGAIRGKVYAKLGIEPIWTD